LLAFGAPARRVEEGDFATKGVVFRSGVPPARIDLLAEVEPLGFSECWKRRSEGLFLDQPVRNLGMEEILSCKRYANRPKDRMDVRMLEKARQAAGLSAGRAKRTRKEPPK
jgi:hypothetical protein